MDISTRNGCISSMLPHRPSSVPPSISLILYWQNCNSIRSAAKYTSRMTLERYDVESCGASLIVRELSLVRSPGVFTPLLFVCKQELLINSSELLRFQYGLAPFQTVVQPIVSHGSEIVLHTRQGAVVTDPMLQCVSRVNVCSSLP